MLDDKNVLRQYDPADTLGAVAHITQQMMYEPVIELGEFAPRAFSQIVLAGMGGSALAADMIRALTEGWLYVPLQVVKGYDLPGYAGADTLVIVLSHSGNTEETLSCYEQARTRGCTVAALSAVGSAPPASDVPAPRGTTGTRS